MPHHSLNGANCKCRDASFAGDRGLACHKLPKFDARKQISSGKQGGGRILRVQDNVSISGRNNRRHRAQGFARKQEG
jgi:hypothetical protein